MAGRMSVVAWSAAAVLGLATLAGGASKEAKIDARAEEHLKAMSDYLGGLKTYTFQVEESFDNVQDDGQKLQFGNQRKVTVSRPGKVYGESEGDTANSKFYYDGKTVTVFDRKHKTYAVEKAPDTIDAMLDDLHKRFGIDAPLADFLFSDPYKVFTENVESGSYVGLHYVGKEKCHHLAFRQKRLDWQIWISAGENPLPRKLVITFKRQGGEPQYRAYIHRWDVNPELEDNTFQFEAPEGVQKVEFLKRHGDPDTGKKPAAN